ncbi:MAG: pirin-like C-terminal cupin domain-containing protein, partial [Bacteroidota bacterium]
QGALEHRDSAGNSGTIYAGDVQWMTAGSGLVHEEKHERNFNKEGGTLEMIQLWVNLPAAHKMTPPKYQELQAKDIPVVALGEQSQVRLIAGDLGSEKGAASTFTDLQVWDVKVASGETVDLAVKNGQTGILYMLSGSATINGEKVVSTKEVAFFDPEGDQISFTAKANSQFVWLGGEAIQEPVFSYGPFVMNTEQEIVEAINDFRAGKMGTLRPA